MKPTEIQQITVGPAVPGDVIGMQEVFYQAWLATYPNEEFGITRNDIEERYKDRLSPEVLAKRTERLLRPTEDGITLIAKENEKVIGLCQMIRHSDHNQLRAIYLLPEYQGRGIGTMLWDEAKKCIDTSLQSIVSVATYNTNAIKFYERLGFVPTGKTWRDEKFKMKSGAVIPEMEMILKP